MLPSLTGKSEYCEEVVHISPPSWAGQGSDAEQKGTSRELSFHRKRWLEQSCFYIRDQRGWISEKHQQQFRVIISFPLKSWQHVLIEKINLDLSHLVPGFIANEGKLLELQCPVMFKTFLFLPALYKKTTPNTTHHLCMKCYFYFVVSLAYQNDINTLHLQNSAAGPELNRLSPKQQCIAVQSNHCTHVLGFTLPNAPTQSQEFIPSHWTGNPLYHSLRKINQCYHTLNEPRE